MYLFGKTFKKKGVVCKIILEGLRLKASGIRRSGIITVVLNDFKVIKYWKKIVILVVLAEKYYGRSE